MPQLPGDFAFADDHRLQPARQQTQVLHYFDATKFTWIYEGGAGHRIAFETATRSRLSILDFADIAGTPGRSKHLSDVVRSCVLGHVKKNFDAVTCRQHDNAVDAVEFDDVAFNLIVDEWGQLLHREQVVIAVIDTEELESHTA